MKNLAYELGTNVDMIKQVFEKNDTVIYRDVESRDGSVKGHLMCLDGMVSTKVINEAVIPVLLAAKTPPSIDAIMKELLFAVELSSVTTFEDAIYAVLAGDTILIVDGFNEIIVIDSKGYPNRGIQEPEGEQVLRGPKEGFNETLMNNMTLIRRRLQNPNLKLEIMHLSTSARVQMCLCYIQGIAKESVVADMRNRLQRLVIEECYDINAVGERIKDGRLSVFKTIGMSERVDITVSKLCEGRVAVLVDGSCGVITAPYIFMENFHAPDDYYMNFYYTSLTRIIRFIGFLVAILLPALYVAMITFHKEIVPFSLLLSIIKARSGVPFPSILEAIVLILCLELLQEATIRGPKQLGTPLSLVAAIVFGDAAINAKLISATMLIVIAFSALSAIMNPRFRASILILRFAFLLAGLLFGFFGIFFFGLVVLTYLFSMTSFQVPYMSTIPSLKGMDNLLRIPSFVMRGTNHGKK